MRKPEDLSLLKTKEYAVVDSDSTPRRENIDERRSLARRREWFNTDDQYLQYLLIVEALEVSIVAEKEDGEDWPVPFSWDISIFGDYDTKI